MQVLQVLLKIEQNFTKKWVRVGNPVIFVTLRFPNLNFLGGHGTLVKQPSLASQVPQETMNALINNTAPSSGERKISFVIQDDSESKTSSQTTLVQVRANVYVISANVFFTRRGRIFASVIY